MKIKSLDEKAVCFYGCKTDYRASDSGAFLKMLNREHRLPEGTQGKENQRQNKGKLSQSIKQESSERLKESEAEYYQSRTV